MGWEGLFVGVVYWVRKWIGIQKIDERSGFSRVWVSVRGLEKVEKLEKQFRKMNQIKKEDREACIIVLVVGDAIVATTTNTSTITDNNNHNNNNNNKWN